MSPQQIARLRMLREEISMRAARRVGAEWQDIWILKILDRIATEYGMLVAEEAIRDYGLYFLNWRRTGK